MGFRTTKGKKAQTVEFPNVISTYSDPLWHIFLFYNTGQHKKSLFFFYPRSSLSISIIPKWSLWLNGWWLNRWRAAYLSYSTAEYKSKRNLKTEYADPFFLGKMFPIWTLLLLFPGLDVSPSSVFLQFIRAGSNRERVCGGSQITLLSPTCIITAGRSSPQKICCDKLIHAQRAIIMLYLIAAIMAMMPAYLLLILNYGTSGIFLMMLMDKQSV